MLPLGPTTTVLPSWINVGIFPLTDVFLASVHSEIGSVQGSPGHTRMGSRVILRVSPDPLNTPPMIRVSLVHF